VAYLALNRDMDSETALDWRERIMGLEHILVDEYQDIGELEYEFLSLLAGRGEADQSRRPSLLAVGDADQNIYAFKGSNVRFIHRFAQDYDAELTYMVAQLPLQGADHSRGQRADPAQPRPDGHPGRGALRKDKGDPVGIIRTAARPAMLKAALEQAHRLVTKDGLAPGDVCILCRTNQEVFAITRLARRPPLTSCPVRRRIPFPNDPGNPGDPRAPAALRQIPVHRPGSPPARGGPRCRELGATIPSGWTTSWSWPGTIRRKADPSAARSGIFQNTCGTSPGTWAGSRRVTAQGIGIATMHGAKGLEFPAVLLVGHPRQESNMEEARRLYLCGHDPGQGPALSLLQRKVTRLWRKSKKRFPRVGGGARWESG
jgi:ATP-dependent DNA helicase RecQ